MRRRQRTKLLALLLSLSFITGSVGMTVSASEADSVRRNPRIRQEAEKHARRIPGAQAFMQDRIQNRI